MKRSKTSRHCLAEPLRAAVPFCLALMLLASASSASPVFRYLEQTGQDSFTFFWQAEPDEDEMTISQRQGDETITSRCAADGSTTSWHHTRVPGTDIRAERTGNRIRFSGLQDGKEVDRSADIDDRPWFQPLSYSLQRMLAGDQQTTEFWTVRPDSLEVIAMEAEYSGIDAITGDDGRVQEANKVIIRPVGMLSAFWQAEYWFRRSDNFFIRYRGTHGPPGTAETSVSLLAP